MRISRIQIDHFAAIDSIDIRVEKPILLCAGGNGVAKSYLADALKMAFTRTAPRGLTKKNQYSMLLNDTAGAKAGGALVTCDNDPDNTFGVVLPKGDFTGADLPDAMRVALDGQSFAQMTPDERRTFLFRLTGRSAKIEDVKQRLLVAKCHPDFIEQALPMIRAGFPKAEEFAKDEAKQKKADWKAITATTWGSVLAETWEAPVPDEAPGDAVALRAQAAAVEQEIATLNQSLGTIRTSSQQANADAQKRIILGVAARRIPELEVLLTTAIAERDEHEKQVSELRQRAKGGAKQGLLHDMARFINGMEVPDADSAAQQALLLASYTKEHGPVSSGSTPDADAIASLPGHERGLAVLQNRATNLQRDLEAARVAKGQYDVLSPADDATDVGAEIAQIERMLEEAREELKRVTNEALNIEVAARGRAEAKSKTEKAKALHEQVTAWLAVADKLSPSGIPAEILKEALAPVNAKLAQAAADSDWPLVTIGEDMEITITRSKARPYAMESKSYRWRADAHIAAVVAEISGLGILCLDEADILEPSDRPQLFSWLDLLATEGIIKTTVIAMTLKQKPTNVLETFQVEWISGGAVEGASQREAA